MELLRQGSQFGESLTIVSSADRLTVAQARRTILASDVVVIVLSPALLYNGRALLEIVAAYDSCKKVLGIVFQDEDDKTTQEPSRATGARVLRPRVVSLPSHEGEVSPRLGRRDSRRDSRRSSLEHDDPQILLDLEDSIKQMLRAGEKKIGATSTTLPEKLAIPSRNREKLRKLLVAAAEDSRLDQMVLLKLQMTFEGLHSLVAPIVKFPLLPDGSSSESDGCGSLRAPAEVLFSLLKNAEDQLKPPPGSIEEHEGRLKITHLLSKKAAWCRYHERVKRKARAARGHLLRAQDGTEDVGVPALSAGETHHVYLCHDSSSSAAHEAMRMIKTRLEQMFGWKLVPQQLRKPLGRAWRLVGNHKPTNGREFVNPRLALALEGNKHTFSVKELRDLEVIDLTEDSFVKANDQYYALASAVAAPEAALKIFLTAPGRKRGEQLASAHCVLVFVSASLFESHSGLRELLTAVRLRKRLVTIMESDPARGGLTIGTARERIAEIFRLGRGDPKLSADEVVDALFGGTTSVHGSVEARSRGSGTWQEPVEWQRIAPFQAVSIRRIAEVRADRHPLHELLVLRKLSFAVRWILRSPICGSLARRAFSCGRPRARIC